VSLAQISRELEVRPDLLRAWQRQQAASAGGPGGVTAERVPSDAEEVRRLQRELTKAQQEIAFLKSAAAYFARESR
jgi:transposase-like protein